LANETIVDDCATFNYQLDVLAVQHADYILCTHTSTGTAYTQKDACGGASDACDLSSSYLTFVNATLLRIGCYSGAGGIACNNDESDVIHNIKNLTLTNGGGAPPADALAPQWLTDTKANITTPTFPSAIYIHANWTDDVQLNQFILSWYNTTHWQNVSGSFAASGCGANCSGASGSVATVGTYKYKFYANDTSDNWNVTSELSIEVMQANPGYYDYGSNVTTLSLGSSAILFSNWTTPAGSLTNFRMNEQLPNGTWYGGNTSAWTPFVCGDYSDCAVEVLSNRSMFPIGTHNFTFIANNSLLGLNETPVFSVTVIPNYPEWLAYHQEIVGGGDPLNARVGNHIAVYYNLSDAYNLSGAYPELWNGSTWLYGSAYWDGLWLETQDYGYTGRVLWAYSGIDFGATSTTHVGTWKWRINFNNSVDNWNITPEMTYYVRYPLQSANSYTWDSTSGNGYFNGVDYYWQDAISAYKSATRGITNIEVIPVTYDVNHDGEQEIIIIDDNQLRVFSGVELNIDKEQQLIGQKFKHYALVENMTANASTSYITISEDIGNAQFNRVDFYWNGTYANYSLNLSSTLTNYEGGQFVFQCDTGKCVIVYNERGYMDYSGGVSTTADELWHTEYSVGAVSTPTMIYNSSGILCMPRYRNMEIIDYFHNGSVRAIFPVVDSDAGKMRVIELDDFGVIRNGSATIGDAVQKTGRVYCEYNATANASHSDIGRMATNIVISNFDADVIEEYLIAFVTTDYSDAATSQDFNFYLWNGSLATVNNYDDGVLLKTDNNGIPGNLFIASPNVANETASVNKAVCTLGNRGDLYGGVLCFSPAYDFTPESTLEYFSLFRPGSTYFPGTWMDYGFSGQHRYTQLLTDGTQNVTGGINPTEFILNGEGGAAGVWDISYVAADNSMNRRYDFGTSYNYTFVRPIAHATKTDFIAFDATNIYYYNDLYSDESAGIETACFNPCIYYPSSGAQTWIQNVSSFIITINGTDFNNLASINVSTRIPASSSYYFLFFWDGLVSNFWNLVPSTNYYALYDWGRDHIGDLATDLAQDNWYVKNFGGNYSVRLVMNYSDTQEVGAWSNYSLPYDTIVINFTNLTRIGEHQGIIQIRDDTNLSVKNLTFPFRVSLSTTVATVSYGDCQWCTRGNISTTPEIEPVVNNSITQAAENVAGWTGLPVKILWLLLMLFVGVIIWVQGGKAEPGLSIGMVVIAELVLLIAGWKFNLISGWVIGLMAVFGLIIAGMIVVNKVKSK